MRVALGWCMLFCPMVTTLPQCFSEGLIAGIVNITLASGLAVLLLAWMAAALCLIQRPNESGEGRRTQDSANTTGHL